jgi:hypothetical protein
MVRRILLCTIMGLGIVATPSVAFRSYKPTYLPPGDLVWYAYVRPDSSGLIEFDRSYMLRVSVGDGPTRQVCLAERSARGLR